MTQFNAHMLLNNILQNYILK